MWVQSVSVKCECKYENEFECDCESECEGQGEVRGVSVRVISSVYVRVRVNWLRSVSVNVRVRVKYLVWVWVKSELNTRITYTGWTYLIYFLNYHFIILSLFMIRQIPNEKNGTHYLKFSLYCTQPKLVQQY